MRALALAGKDARHSGCPILIKNTVSQKTDVKISWPSWKTRKKKQNFIIRSIWKFWKKWYIYFMANSHINTQNWGLQIKWIGFRKVFKLDFLENGMVKFWFFAPLEAPLQGLQTGLAKFWVFKKKPNPVGFIVFFLGFIGQFWVLLNFRIFIALK